MAEPGTSYTGLDTAAWIAYGATVLCYGAFFFVGFRFTRHLQISRMLSANGFFVSKMVLQKASSKQLFAFVVSLSVLILLRCVGYSGHRQANSKVAALAALPLFTAACAGDSLFLRCASSKSAFVR